MLASYLPILILASFAIIMGAVIIALSSIIGRRKPTNIKLMPYECGMDPIGPARFRFSVKFFIIAILFIVFDIEAIFLYPWALIYKKLHFYGFVEMFVFILILLLGLVYAWKKGALEWE